jgi:type I restriction enzyme, S subunit
MSKLEPLHELVYNVSDAFHPSRMSAKQFLLYSFEAHDAGKKPVVVAESEMKSSKKVVRAGDVLFAKLNPRIPRAWLVDDAGDGMVQLCSTEFVVLRPKNPRELDPEYLAWTLVAPQFLAPVQAQVSSSTKSHQRVRPEFILDQCVPFRSAAEQKRVAGRINECLDRVEEMQQLLVEGEEERFHLLAATLRDLFQEAEASGKPTSIGAVTLASKYGTNVKCSENGGGIPILRIPNVAGGRVNLEKLKFARLSDRERVKIRLENADLLVVRTNGSPDLVGRCAVFKESGDFGYASYLIRFKLDCAAVMPDYVSLFLQSPQGRDAIAQIRQTSAGQYNVNSENLRNVLFPLVKPKVQAAVIEKALAVQTIAESIGEELKQTALESNALRQSILREAFAGNL